MGYITYYDLTTAAGKPFTDIPGFKEKFKDITSYDVEYIGGGIKWYDVEEDMLTISSLYPDTVFRLYWNGEELDDEGILYFWNGETTGEVRPAIPEPKLTNLPGFAEAMPELLI